MTLAFVACRARARWSSGTTSARPASASSTLTRSVTRSVIALVRVPRPRLGYALTALSAACSALNGSLARYLLDDGISAARLSQLRSAVAFLLLLGALAAFAPGRLRIARADMWRMAWLGIAGIARRSRWRDARSSS